MDPDFLRLILLLLGVVLVAAIYLGDKYKNRPRPKPQPRRQDPKLTGEPAAPHTQADVINKQSATSASADLSDAVVPDPELQANPAPKSTAVVADKAGSSEEVQLPSIKADSHLPEKEPLELTEADAMPINKGLPSTEFSFSAHGKSDPLSMNPMLEGEVPRLLLQLNIMRRKTPITGDEILALAEELDLRAGKMDIFHRYDSSAENMVLYSMANMIKPGSFPLDDMTEFKTPGVTLFTMLPGFRDGIAIYSDMLFTAERMITMLDAELQDETHSVMTRQTIEHTREKILEHRRQVQLAQKRL